MARTWTYSNTLILGEQVAGCQMNESKRINRRWRVDLGVELLLGPGLAVSSGVMGYSCIEDLPEHADIL